jgi:hypothetical protein
MAIIVKRSKEFTDLLQRNLKARYEDRKRIDNTVHVSDIIPTTCIRKQYYSRKFPDEESLSNETVHHFVRGESSEFVITQLANMGVAQAGDTVVELKDTINGKRLDFYDQTFRSYLRQLLYYLIMTGIEKGILSIRYNIKELKWVKSDSQGDYFFRPFEAKDAGIESWEVVLPKDDIAREILKNEMMRRKNLFLRALDENNVSVLPRLIDEAKRSKCPYCQFYDRCINQDSESDEAKKMAKEIDLLDIKNIVNFNSCE